MKNILSLTGILCLFATLIFTSCGKNNEFTDTSVEVMTEQEVTAFLDKDPSVEEVKNFFSNLTSKTTANESINSLEDIPAEYADYLTIDPASDQLEEGDVASRVCGDIAATAFFNSAGVVMLAHDPTNNTNNYIALLKRNGVIIGADVEISTNTILYTSSLPNCGNYTAEVYAQENEIGCTTIGYQLVATASKTITDCL